ncbi:MAG: hypothetical protein ABIP55_04165, partial [Tepidisphaeraceae bacterium]
MLSARAYSFRQKSKLAISLSWVGGYVNVVLLLSCASFASHMTGNALTFFNENSALGLRAVIEKLKSQRRELILSGITRAQYKLLDRSGVLEVTDSENLCP